MAGAFDPDRFIRAQDQVYGQVLAELRGGRKTSHWMWFIFPQIRGLGFSSTAQTYAIASRAEAEAYLAHPILGPRLVECTELVNAVEGKSIEDVFGSIDAMKFRSSMTLFREAAREPKVFTAALERYFGGEADPLTIERLH